MADRFREDPYRLLNVARNAPLADIEAAFARLYKAARFAPDADARRQALNQALETLRDPDARAAADVAGWHLPLAPDQTIPDRADLFAALLPPAPDEPVPAADAVPGPAPAEVVADWLRQQPAPNPPTDRDLLRQLAARLALEAWDPWEMVDDDEE